MAKFQIEVDLDWMEDSTIDQEIKSAVVSRVTKDVTEKVHNEIIKEVNQSIINQIKARVDETYQKILNSPITVTDKWGEEKEHYGSLESAVKNRFDKYMLEHVDASSGKPTNYGTKVSRVNYIIDSRIKKHSEKFMKEAITKVEDFVKTALDQKLKEHVGNKLVNLVQLDKFIESRKS